MPVHLVSTMPPYFCPMPHRYAAIRMDPVAMVEHLDDPLALAAARAIEARTYLVYIEEVRSESFIWLLSRVSLADPTC